MAKKKTFRQKIGELVNTESGKSQIKMGDAMEFQKLVFKKCATDPEFLAKGLMLAARDLKK